MNFCAITFVYAMSAICELLGKHETFYRLRIFVTAPGDRISCLTFEIDLTQKIDFLKKSVRQNFFIFDML